MDINKLQAISHPIDAKTQNRMQVRKSERYWKAASANISAKIIRQLRLTNKTPSYLAEILGISPENIHQYLHGTYNFDLKTLIAIERALDINILDRNL